MELDRIQTNTTRPLTPSGRPDTPPDCGQLIESADDKARKAFLEDLNKFHTNSGKGPLKVPIMGYKELDLYQFFVSVSAQGGFHEIVKSVGTWTKIWKTLSNYDPSITDASFRLKKNYERYLLDYENFVFPERKQQNIEAQKQKNESKNKPKAEKKKVKRKSSSTVKEILREGTVKLPLTLGEITVHSLGTLISKRPFVTHKHIWPVGFCTSRYFSSMVDPTKRVKYTNQILSVNGKPQFVVTASDDLKNPIISHSPSAAWRTVLKRVTEREESETRKNISVSGALRFGLAHPAVIHLIRNLPDADKCLALMNQNFSSNVQQDKPDTSSPKFKRSIPEDLSIVGALQELYDSPRVKRKREEGPQTKEEESFDDFELATSALMSLTVV
jgi:hypothetical protein